MAAELGEDCRRRDVGAGGLGTVGRVLATDIDRSSRAGGVLAVLRYEVRTTYSGTRHSGPRHFGTTYSGTTYSGTTDCATRRLRSRSTWSTPGWIWSGTSRGVEFVDRAEGGAGMGGTGHSLGGGASLAGCEARAGL